MLLLSQREESLDQTEHCLVRGKRGGIAPHAPNRNPLKQVAQILVKDDHQHDQEDSEETLQDPGRQLKSDLSGRQIDTSQHEHPNECQTGLRAFHPNDDAVGEQRHQRDVEDVL
jgi:hypothetical protein